MAGYNKTSSGSMRTINRSGHTAYKLDDRTKLVTMTLTTMLGEPKYYGDNTDELIQLAEKLCTDGDGEFVAKLAVWARTRGNLRSVSHALMAVVAFNCSGETFVRPAARAIASVRGDDGTEMLATYKALYGKKVRWPHALQRGIRDALEASKPYAIAKYQSGNREMKLRDTLRITHPNASRDDTTKAMGECVAGTLHMPKGWETELSERGNTKEVWDELIRENRLGIFACLRNLKHMLKVGADVEPVLRRLEDPETIANSRILPFRFYAAYRGLDLAGLCTTRVARALDAAMGHACQNVEGMGGRTAVLIDVSGSMTQTLSARSKSSCSDVAAVFGAMVAHVADDAWACGFNNTAKRIPMGGMSVLSDASNVPFPRGGTAMDAGFSLLMNSGFDADRVVVLSDNEVNSCYGTWYSYGGNGQLTIQRCLDAYRRKVGHDVWCHAIDLQGYGTSQFIGPKVNVMAGWSDQTLRFISIAESGFGSMVSEIDGMVL